MPMGIYRPIFPQASCGPARAMGFVIARPSADLVLQAEDCVYVMAPFSWAYRMLHSEGVRQPRRSAEDVEELRQLNEIAQHARVDAFSPVGRAEEMGGVDGDD